MAADPLDHLLQLRVGQRLAARQGDDHGPEAGERIDPLQQGLDRDGFGDLVELVAVGAVEVAEAGHHHVGQQRARLRQHRRRNQFQTVPERDAGHSHLAGQP